MYESPLLVVARDLHVDRTLCDCHLLLALSYLVALEVLLKHESGPYPI